MLDRVKIINFTERGDDKGWLVALENNKEIPFDIKRIFYIYRTEKNVVRGQHANKKSKFVLISVSGSCKVKTFDGIQEMEFTLDKPNIGLFLDTMVWKDMYDFSPDCVLLVLSNASYDPDEYVFDIEVLNNE